MRALTGKRRTLCLSLSHGSFLLMLSGADSHFELFLGSTRFDGVTADEVKRMPRPLANPEGKHTHTEWIVFGSVACSVVMEMTSGDWWLRQFHWFRIPEEAAVCLT